MNQRWTRKLAAAGLTACMVCTVPWLGGVLSPPVLAEDVPIDPETDYIIRDGRIIFFSDIEDHWAFEYILDLREQGGVNGFPDRTFRPEGTITRAEFVTLLARLAVEDPEEDLKAYAGVASFNDVRQDDWYCKYVEWGWEKNVAHGFPVLAEDLKPGEVLGYGAEFRPNDPISRQDAAVLLTGFVDAAQVKLADRTSTDRTSTDRTSTDRGMTNQALTNPGLAGTEAFADQEEISEYAKASVLGLRQAGIVSGERDLKSGRTYFWPKAMITRAEAASMIDRLIGSIPEHGTL